MNHSHEISFPPQVLWAAGGLVLMALAGTVAVRAGLFPEVANPQAMRAEAHVQPLVSRDLRFADGADGSVIVTDMSGRTVATIRPDSEQGFVRGVMRGLARERRLKEAGMEAPFRLQLWADNGLTLTDLATGRQIELGAFGPTNRAAFAVLLDGKAA